MSDSSGGSRQPGSAGDSAVRRSAEERRAAAEQRDAAAAARDDVAEHRDVGADERDRSWPARSGSSDSGDAAAGQRDVGAEVRDRRARHRDEVAVERDRRAEQRDRAFGRSRAHPGCAPGPGTAEEVDELRLAATSDRQDSAHDRLDAADDRAESDHDRAESARDRGSASGRRYESGQDRAASADDRGASMGDRRAAGVDRSWSRVDRHTARVEGMAATLDGLTGAHLRGPGLVELERELARAARTASPLALVFVDIDGLKAVNDTGGHAAGDRLLLEVVTTLRRYLRPYDLVIRFGGDEFICVLVGLDAAEAGDRMADVNTALAQSPEGGSVTVGIATLAPRDSVESLIGRADAALYRRKGAN